MGALFCIAVFAMSAAAQTVTGSGTSGTVPVFNGTSTVTNSPIAVSGGNVGIGTTSPSAILEIDVPNDVTAASPIVVNANNNLGITFCRTFGAVDPGCASFSTITYGILNLNSDNGIAFNPANAQAIVINAQGKVGIGPSSVIPFNNSLTNLLTVGGGVSIGASYATTVAPTNGLMVQGNVGIGTTTPAYSLDVAGAVHVAGAINASGVINASTSGVKYSDGTTQTTAWTGVLCGGDYAEAVKAAGEKKLYEPGDVLVLVDDSKGDVRKSSEPYSALVAGIYATKPGVIGKRQSLKDESTEVPIAMVGIVPTKVTAENGVHRGDLLVSSSVPGYAMKGTDRARMLGAVIGKAMGSLDSGTGVIEVLVTLQ